MTDSQPAEVECTECGGRGCDHCDNGYFAIRDCPQRYIGNELIADMNVISSCANGVLPVAGGLLDQTSYYFELSTALKAEQASIDRERSERRRKRVGY